MKFSIKKLISFFAMLCLLFSASACTTTNKPVTARFANLTPDSFVFKSSDGFEFIQLHNDVVDRLYEEGTDIFYVTGNTLDVDGDNEKKEIYLRFEVFAPTSDREIELAISWFMKLIADACCVQQGKYEPATTESFGTVWNDYTLVIDVNRTATSDKEESDALKSYHRIIKAGETIPFEPRAITWGDDYIESEEPGFEFERN